VLGPTALGVVPDSGATRLLASSAWRSLLFTLGLEFSLPRHARHVARVFGLGAAQVIATAGVFALFGHLLGIAWLIAIVLGGRGGDELGPPSLLQQLTERAELKPTHGRLAPCSDWRSDSSVTWWRRLVTRKDRFPACWQPPVRAVELARAR